MENPLSGRVGLNTTDFKTAIQSMNRELRVLESGFRANAAQLGDWANTEAGLEMRIKSLTGSIDIQKQKVAAVRGEYERIKGEKGETSKAAQDLEIKLNKENETLGKMTNELQGTNGRLEELRSDSGDAAEGVADLGSKSAESSGKLEGLKGAIGGVGDVAKSAILVMAGLVAGVAAVGLAITGMVFSATRGASEIQDLSDKTGISTTKLQEFAFIGHQTGVALDTITDANARLIRSQNAARDGQGEQAKAFDTLGVSAIDASGNLRDSQEVFSETLDALGQIENPTERDALAMQIFGKSAQELNPLIKEGSEGLAELAAQAEESGAVMSEENVAALDTFGDKLAGLKDGLLGTLGTLSSAFLPGFTSIFDTIGGYAKEFSGIVSGSGGDFGAMAEGLTGLLTRIVGDIAAKAPQLVQAGVTIIQSLIGAIIEAFPQLLQAGIQIIQTLLKAITTMIPQLIKAGIPILVGLISAILGALPLLLQAAVQILLTLVNSLIQNLPMLIEAAVQAVLALAQGLADALPVLIPAVVQAVLTIVETLVNNIPMLIEAALSLILGLANGLIAALPVLIPQIPRILQAIVDALIKSLPMIGDAAVELIMALLTGIIGALPMLGTAAVQIIELLTKGVADLVGTLLDVGKNIVVGIWNGISAQADWFWDQITGFFSGIVDAVKDALGISSPSKIMFIQGIETIRGFGLGAQQEFREMERQLRAAFGGLTLSPAFSTGSSVSNRSEAFAFYAPVYFQGSATPDSLGEAIKGKRF